MYTVKSHPYYHQNVFNKDDIMKLDKLDGKMIKVENGRGGHSKEMEHRYYKCHLKILKL